MDQGFVTRLKSPVIVRPQSASGRYTAVKRYIDIHRFAQQEAEKPKREEETAAETVRCEERIQPGLIENVNKKP